MTDRYNYLTVALEQDTRSDDAEPLIAAIRMLRGVLDVQPHVTGAGDWTAAVRIREELRKKLWDLLVAS